MSGQNVSFSQRKTKRQFKPNVQKATFWENGNKIRKNVCTRCLKTTSKAV